MKRLLLAAVIALVVHGLLLAVKPPWFLNPVNPEDSRPLSIRLQMLSPPAPVAPDPNVIPSEEPEPENQPEPPPELPPEPVLEPAPEPIADPIPEPEPVPESMPVPEPAPVKEKRAVEAPEPEKKPGPQPAAPEKTEMPYSDHSTPSEPSVSAPVESIPLIQTPPVRTVREAKPRYLENKPPDYPRTARRRGHSGTVMLEVLVSAEGHAEEVRVFSSSGHRVLDESALEAVGKWRFEPGTVTGAPVAMWVKVPVRFDLK